MTDSTPNPAQRGETTDEALEALQQEGLDTAPPHAGDDQPGPEPPGDEQDALHAALQEAEARALRMQAELENFRKRARREMDEERRYAGLPLIRDLLLVVDNLQRAVQAAEQDENAAGLLEGVRLCADQMLSTLAQHNCHPIEAIGQPFDPNLHEAIGQLPSNDYPAGTVALETRVGYQLHDRVVRPSQIMVASAPAPAHDSAAPETTETDASDHDAQSESPS